jgi:uroporphyrinogen-III synthase
MAQLGVLLTNSRTPLHYEKVKWLRHGIKVYHQPLLSVVDLPIAPLTMVPQAIVLTSANGAACLQKSNWDRRIPVFGVGSATVAAAKTSGFVDCSSPNSRPYPSAINLVSWIKLNLRPARGIIIHGSGERLRHDMAEMLKEHEFETLRVVLYKTETADAFNPEIEQALKDGTIQEVQIASEQALQTFVDLCKKSNIDFKKIKPLLPSHYMKKAASKAGFVIDS